MAEKSKRKRIYMLDELRGFAILCMILHHTFLDVGDVLGFSWGYQGFVGAYNGALETIDKAIIADESDAKSYEVRGCIYYYFGNMFKAFKKYDKAWLYSAWCRTYNYAFHRCNYAAFRL